MKISKEQLLFIKHELLLHVTPKKFNDICRAARIYIDHMPLYDGGYSRFWINKRTKEKVFSKAEVKQSQDKHREICAPTGEWKVVCKNLNKLFMPMVNDRYWLHGFVEGKGVLTNAEYHVRNKANNCINIDLENAFGQIDYKNLTDFAINVFGWKSRTAHKFANIMTHKGHMVQGNPLSPLMMNLFALYLDYRLIEFFKQSKGKKSLYMTRYADDVTISSPNKIEFKTFLITSKIISQCGWKINRKKTKFSWKIFEVTGVMVYYGKRFKTRRGRKRRFIKDLRALKRMQKSGKLFLDRMDRNGKPISIEGVISGIYAWLFPKAQKPKRKKRSKVNKKFSKTKQNKSSQSVNKKFTKAELLCRTNWVIMRPASEVKW